MGYRVSQQEKQKKYNNFNNLKASHTSLVHAFLGRVKQVFDVVSFVVVFFVAVVVVWHDMSPFSSCFRHKKRAASLKRPLAISFDGKDDRFIGGRRTRDYRPGISSSVRSSRVVMTKTFVILFPLPCLPTFYTLVMRWSNRCTGCSRCAALSSMQ